MYYKIKLKDGNIINYRLTESSFLEIYDKTSFLQFDNIYSLLNYFDLCKDDIKKIIKEK